MNNDRLDYPIFRVKKVSAEQANKEADVSYMTSQLLDVNTLCKALYETEESFS